MSVEFFLFLSSTKGEHEKPQDYKLTINSAMHFTVFISKLFGCHFVFCSFTATASVAVTVPG